MFTSWRPQSIGILFICTVPLLLIAFRATFASAQSPFPWGPPPIPGRSTPPATPPPPKLGATPTPQSSQSQAGPHVWQLTENGIVNHAATPAQLSVVGTGLQYYFIGADGSSATGPHIPNFLKLKADGVTTIFSGANPLTGKPVTIDYLAAENRIRVSTFYPDNEYDTNKPYIFRFGPDYTITVEAW